MGRRERYTEIWGRERDVYKDIGEKDTDRQLYREKGEMEVVFQPRKNFDLDFKIQLQLSNMS